MELKIEKGVALPARKGLGITEVIRKMSVGDSVYVPGKHNQELYNIAAQMNRTDKTKKKFATRKENGGCRVWRTK